jgi:hypothetical protein
MVHNPLHEVFFEISLKTIFSFTVGGGGAGLLGPMLNVTLSDRS